MWLTTHTSNPTPASNRTLAPIPWDPEANGGCLPSTRQENLLGAALFAPAQAVAAWHRWRAEVDPTRDFIDPGSVRLLPLVYENLRPCDLDDPYLQSLKALHHQTVFTNQIQLHGCAQLLDLLHAAGIPTLTLKGAALVSQYYPTVGTRPMGDFDVLVPHAQAEAALAVLDAAEWRPVGLAHSQITPALLQVRHAQNFSGPNRRQIDLHWYALAGSMDPALDRQLWDQAQPLTLHNVTTQTLCPTDQLIHVCVHGAAWSSVPPVRWIPDAVMTLRAAADAANPAPAIDWTRLLELARAYQLGMSLHHTLSYLQAHILPQVAAVDALPAPVLDTLAQMPTTRAERRLFRAHTQRSTRLGQLPLLWARYRAYRARIQNARAHRDAGKGGRLSFPGYIAVYYGYRGLSEVLGWAMMRSRERIQRMRLGLRQ
ncbi:MAG: nucleotidyltransferase family protein [Litorilinea sp.]